LKLFNNFVAFKSRINLKWQIFSVFMDQLSIVMPAYNEEKRIGRTLEAYSKYFEKIRKSKKLEYEILVVINNTKDRTEEIVKKLQIGNKRIRYLNLIKGGKGYAVVQGFIDALKRNNDYISFVDSDMATSAGALYDLYKKIGRYDGIIGSRWIKGAIVETPQTILRRITSRGFNFLVRSILLMPYTDTQCGAKLFRKKTLERVVNELGTTEWAFDIDLLYRLRRNGFKIVEAATVWKDVGGSKLNLKKVPFKMFSSIIRLRLLYSPLNFIVRLYNKLPENRKIHSW
jgi:glycosyltransferase involved in cell wall biosynthesis